MNKKQTLAHLV